MRLMALEWTGASKSDFDAASKAWIRQQRADGGWAQFEHMEPDAYTTGITLVALERFRREPFYERGVQWLLKEPVRVWKLVCEDSIFPGAAANGKRLSVRV